MCIRDRLGPCSTGPDTPELLAALEATFALHPAPRTIRVVAPLPRQSPLFTQGILLSLIHIFNLNNVFDRKYYDQIGFYSQGWYGAPRNVMLTVRAQY